MIKRVIPAFSRALFDTDLIASRMILSAAEMFWAIMLFWPGNSFDRPTYSVMAVCFPETVWAIMFLLMGLMQISIVITEEFHSTFARTFAALNAIFWTFVVVSMLLSVSPPPAAIGGEVALAMAAIWIFVRPYVLYRGIVRARTRTI